MKSLEFAFEINWSLLSSHSCRQKRVTRMKIGSRACVQSCSKSIWMKKVKIKLKSLDFFNFNYFLIASCLTDSFIDIGKHFVSFTQTWFCISPCFNLHHFNSWWFLFARDPSWSSCHFLALFFFFMNKNLHILSSGVPRFL